MNLDYYIQAVLKLKSQKEIYEDLNKRIQKIQQDSDFATRLNPIDCSLERFVVDVLDDALFSLTGIHELASYYLYERIDVWRINTREGYVFTWTNDEEFEKAVIEMVKTKRSKK